MTSLPVSASRRTPRSAPSAVLRDAGLVTANSKVASDAGRFGASAYRLTVDTSVLTCPMREPLTATRPTLAPQPRLGSKPVAARGQQLVLLPSV